MKKITASSSIPLSNQLETLLQTVRDGVLIVDDRLHVLAANTAFTSACCSDAQSKNGSCSDIVDVGLEAFVICSESPCMHSLQKTLYSCKSVNRFQFDCPVHSGEPCAKELTCHPIMDDAGGRCLGAVLVVKDFSCLNGLHSCAFNRKGFQGVVGKAPAMRKVYDLIDQVAPVDATVLITGESGTGKELIAEAIHNSSPRMQNPLVKVNCSALSENLLESELFGHVRGAFTGAVRDMPGRIQVAQGGTLFLDEIGELSPRVQVKLLRFIENKEYERVGESRTRRADVRLLAATNVNLERAVKSGYLRSDLYYRLMVMQLSVPPLRERLEDIPALVDHFVAYFSRRFRRDLSGVSDNVLRLFMRYLWPGNVRELKHTVEHACVLCPGGTIGRVHLPREFHPCQENANVPPAVEGDERSRIVSCLNRTDWNKAKVARMLGMSRSKLYRRMASLGIVEENTLSSGRK